MATRSKTLAGTGVGLCVAGAVGLIVGGVLNVDAADPLASVAGEQDGPDGSDGSDGSALLRQAEANVA